MVALLMVAVLLSSGCASLFGRDQVNVTLAGVEPLVGAGFEVRMLVKLRVQNPNDAPLDYSGVALQMDVQGKPFATGVSAVSGSVPRFGETIITVPVTISGMNIARQALGVMHSKYIDNIEYEVSGKFAGPVLQNMRFRSEGKIALPAAVVGGAM